MRACTKCSNILKRHDARGRGTTSRRGAAKSTTRTKSATSIGNVSQRVHETTDRKRCFSSEHVYPRELFHRGEVLTHKRILNACLTTEKHQWKCSACMRRHSILAVLPGPLTSVLTSVLGHSVGNPPLRGSPAEASTGSTSAQKHSDKNRLRGALHDGQGLAPLGDGALH